MITTRVSAMVLGFLTLVQSAWGQVSIDLVLDQEQYLPNESLMASVRITNLSGQSLRLGKNQDWLQFSIEPRDSSSIVTKISDPPVEGEFVLDSSKMATRTVDIAPHFNLARIGRYRISATVKIDQWDQVLSSPAKTFDIINGVRLWEKTFGVPTPGGMATAPEVRKYILQKATYLKKLRLYVRVTDSQELTTFRVLSIGNAVSFGQPEAQLDKNCNLHVLNQFGPRSFAYCVIDPNGALLVRQVHDYAGDSRPTLKPDRESNVRVAGGLRKLAPDDFPPRPPESKSSIPSPTGSTHPN